jgi:hypothetical protein
MYVTAQLVTHTIAPALQGGTPIGAHINSYTFIVVAPKHALSYRILERKSVRLSQRTIQPESTEFKTCGIQRTVPLAQSFVSPAQSSTATSRRSPDMSQLWGQTSSTFLCSVPDRQCSHKRAESLPSSPPTTNV